MEIIIDEEIFRNMLNSPIGFSCETGGYIGVSNNVVVEYWFDEGILGTNSYTYIPDAEKFEKFITMCNEKRIERQGILHTHLNKDATLSNKDRIFIEKILGINPQIVEMYFPVVIPGKTLRIYKGKKIKGVIKIIENKISII